jgi:hypothetical protein
MYAFAKSRRKIVQSTRKLLKLGDLHPPNFTE